MRDLRRRLAREVVGVEVQRAVAVGGEVDRVADPHGIALRALRGRDGRERRRGEIVDEEVLGPPALVALPRAEVAEERRVDDPLPVRREVARAGGRHRQGRSDPAADRHSEQLRLRTHTVGFAHRAEEDRPAVRRPPDHLVVPAVARLHGPARRVVGEQPRRAPFGRDHVHLLVAFVLAGEGDPLSVGRVLGELLDARVRREPRGGAALRGDRPDVARVAEGDAVARDVGIAQQLRLRECRRGEESGREQYRGIQGLGHAGPRRGVAANAVAPLAAARPGLHGRSLAGLQVRG